MARNLEIVMTKYRTLAGIVKTALMRERSPECAQRLLPLLRWNERAIAIGRCAPVCSIPWK
jgi:hypothetical protein